MEDIVEDQLSLASIHYLRSHYQEAIDIYKRILLDNREYLALNVYVALCYYKLDYYDVSQEVGRMIWIESSLYAAATVMVLGAGGVSAALSHVGDCHEP